MNLPDNANRARLPLGNFNREYLPIMAGIKLAGHHALSVEETMMLDVHFLDRHEREGHRWNRIFSPGDLKLDHTSDGVLYGRNVDWNNKSIMVLGYSYTNCIYSV